jgi:hypothetical protein
MGTTSSKELDWSIALKLILKEWNWRPLARFSWLWIVVGIGKSV